MERCLEPSMQTLEVSLSAMGIRRDSAHAESVASEKVRKHFFAVADRWFDGFMTVCLASHARQEILEALRPLPLVTENATLDWIDG